MQIEEFYEKVGGSFSEVLGRLMTRERVEKYVKRFLSDRSFAELSDGYERQDWNAVFLAAHTMKGVCGTLGFKNLMKASSELTENVRSKAANADTEGLFMKLSDEYRNTVGAIREYAGD